MPKMQTLPQKALITKSITRVIHATMIVPKIVRKSKMYVHQKIVMPDFDLMTLKNNEIVWLKYDSKSNCLPIIIS